MEIEVAALGKFYRCLTVKKMSEEKLLNLTRLDKASSCLKAEIKP